MKINKTVCDIKGCEAERDNSLIKGEGWLVVTISQAVGAPRGARTLDLCPKHGKALLEFIQVDDPEPAESPID